MAISYFKSGNIDVYPTAFRGTFTKDSVDYVYNVESSINTEANQKLTSYINKDTFIITQPEDVKLNQPFEFFIHGYYFKIKELTTELFNTSTQKLKPCWLGIKLEPVSLGNDQETLILRPFVSSSTIQNPNTEILDITSGSDSIFNGLAILTSRNDLESSTNKSFYYYLDLGQDKDKLFGKIKEIDLENAIVTTDKIKNLNVTTEKLNTNSVITEKIKDENVTEPKLATDSVTTNKIKNQNITTAKIKDDAVTADKIADSSVHNYHTNNDVINTDTVSDNGTNINLSFDNNHKIKPNISHADRGVSHAIYAEQLKVYNPETKTYTNYDINISGVKLLKVEDGMIKEVGSGINVGNTYTPIYLENGELKKCTTTWNATGYNLVSTNNKIWLPQYLYAQNSNTYITLSSSQITIPQNVTMTGNKVKVNNTLEGNVITANSVKTDSLTTNKVDGNYFIRIKNSSSSPSATGLNHPEENSLMVAYDGIRFIKNLVENPSSCSYYNWTSLTTKVTNNDKTLLYTPYFNADEITVNTSLSARNITVKSQLYTNVISSVSNTGFIDINNGLRIWKTGKIFKAADHDEPYFKYPGFGKMYEFRKGTSNGYNVYFASVGINSILREFRINYPATSSMDSSSDWDDIYGRNIIEIDGTLTYRVKSFSYGVKQVTHPEAGVDYVTLSDRFTITIDYNNWSSVWFKTLSTSYRICLDINNSGIFFYITSSGGTPIDIYNYINGGFITITNCKKLTDPYNDYV